MSERSRVGAGLPSPYFSQSLKAALQEDEDQVEICVQPLLVRIASIAI